MERFYYFLLRLKLFEMFVVNYFSRPELVNKLLTDAKIDIKKVCWYCKYCKKCERFYSIRSKFKKKGFSKFNKGTKYWDVRDSNNLKLYLLEIVDFECNFCGQVFKPIRECEHVDIDQRGHQ